MVIRLVNRSRTISSSQLPVARVASYTIAISAFFVLCWSPYWIAMLYLNLYRSYSDTSDSADADFTSSRFILIMYGIHSLPYFCSSSNWLLYGLLNSQLMRRAHESKKLVGTSTVRRENSRTQTAVAVAPLRQQPLSHSVQRLTIVPTRATLRYSLEPTQQELQEKPQIQTKPPKIACQTLEVHTPPVIVEQKPEMLTESTITAQKMTENSELPVTLSFLIPAAKTAIAKHSDTCRSVSPVRKTTTNKIQSNAECQDFIDVDVGDSTTYLSWNSSLDHFDAFIRKTYGTHLQMAVESKEPPEDKTQSPRSV
ncbi:putative G-protein coupled receptor C06G4.5 [Aphelenchoides besseyi]|nr:putative G-protein coupled receptor C06G4.5 [Aphelenchoides besseyi]